MADEQDKPVASTPAPPAEPVRPKRDRWGAVRGLAALTWVQIIAAGLIGGLVGGGIVSLFANGGDDHQRRGDKIMMVDGPFRGGERYFDRGRGDDRGWPVPIPPRRWQGDPTQPNYPVPPVPTPATPSVSPSPTSTS